MRGISPDAVYDIIENGEIIASYQDDNPYPSALMLGSKLGKPIHVVVADNEQIGERYIVTVYHPDPAVWNQDFKTRRQL